MDQLINSLPALLHAAGDTEEVQGNGGRGCLESCRR
jgi:hypothetical protein